MRPHSLICHCETCARMAAEGRAAKGCRVVVAGNLVLWWPS